MMIMDSLDKTNKIVEKAEEFQKQNHSILDVGNFSAGKNDTKKSTMGKSDAPPKPPRAVKKNGDYNIIPFIVPKSPLFRDTFTTLVDSRWRWTIIIFTAGFFGSWTLFAVAWWLLALLHGDLHQAHLPPHQAASNWTPCVTDIHGFASCFLFSVETQHTTGYGEKRPTEKCLDAVALMCLQNVVGLAIEAFLVGVFFAKMTRPKLRAQTIRFSRLAVVGIHDGAFCLAFRVGDLGRRSGLIDTRVQAKLVRPARRPAKLALDPQEDLLLMFSDLVLHKIDENSPFFHLTPGGLAGEEFEVVVSLEGTIESTDQKTQARTSYLAGEVVWGRWFESIVSVDGGANGYRVECSRFEETVPVEGMPACSAAEFCCRGLKGS